MPYQVQVASEGETSCKMPWPKLGSLHTHLILASSSLHLDVQMSWLEGEAISACMKVILTKWQIAHAALG